MAPSARSTLNSGVRLAWEGEAPAEPQPPDSVSPGSRLSRSFALPNWLAATPRLSVDGALDTQSGVWAALPQREYDLCKRDWEKIPIYLFGN